MAQDVLEHLLRVRVRARVRVRVSLTLTLEHLLVIGTVSSPEP
jgi:hypothetical protein